MDAVIADEIQTCEYTRLAENAFRVLKVLSLEPIIFTPLIERCYDEEPKYHALSYAWGTQDNTEVIFCNGKTL
jgi:hypothetical protein